MYPTIVQADDEELKKRIVISLQARGVDSFDDMHVHVSGGIVTLCGKFTSAYERHLAQECCRHVAGVLRIIDEAEIGGDGDSSAAFAPRELAAIVAR